MIKKKRSKKKGFSLREQYIKSWQYIKESRNFIYVIIGVFFVFALIGFFVPVPDFLVQYILDIIEKIIKQTEGMSQFELIRFIFLNNLQSSFLGMVFGIVLGIFPLISSIFNGYVLGFVGYIGVSEEGASILLRLLPHGIFELPAVFISLGLGLRLGFSIFQKNVKLRDCLLNSLRVFLLVVVPLLIIAAAIEGSLIFIIH